MHLRLTPQPVNRRSELFAVRTYGATHGLVVIKDCSKSERQHRRPLKACADHARMLYDRLLSELAIGHIFAHDHGKVAARIPKYLGSIHSTQIFNRKRTSCSCGSLE